MLNAVQKVSPLDSIVNYSFITDMFSINITRKKMAVLIDVKMVILRDKNN